MATGKRQPSKQKRAAQNRAQRAALAARRDAATASSHPAARATSGERAGGGLLGRLRGGGGGTGLRATAAAGRAGQPVGYRAGLAALLMSVAGVIFCFTFSVPVDADDEPFTRETLTATWAGTALEAAVAAPDASATELAEGIDEWTPGRGETPIALALWPFSLTLALPVIGAGLGFRAVAKRSASRIVSRALFATLFGSLLSQIPIFFLPSVIALGVAVFQIRKYETTLARAGAAGVMEDDDVIDVDALDDDEIAADDKPPVEVADADDVEPVLPDERSPGH
jgi:hypothetical protein